MGGDFGQPSMGTSACRTTVLLGTANFESQFAVRCSHSRNYPHLVENEGLFQSSQKPPCGPILSHMNPDVLPSSFLKISFNIILPSTLRSSKRSLVFSSFTQTLYAFLFSQLATYPAHFILLDLIILLIFRKYHAS